MLLNVEVGVHEVLVEMAVFYFDGSILVREDSPGSLLALDVLILEVTLVIGVHGEVFAIATGDGNGSEEKAKDLLVQVVVHTGGVNHIFYFFPV